MLVSADPLAAVRRHEIQHRADRDDPRRIDLDLIAIVVDADRIQVDGLADARKLMDELSELPSMTQISTQVNSAERRTPKSDDAGVELAIQSQFRVVREMLGRFLDAKSVTQLQYEVNTSGEDGEKKPDAAEADGAESEAAQETPADKSSGFVTAR